MARTGRPKAMLSLPADEEAALRRQSRARRAGRAQALRAQVILACSKGRSNREVAATFALAEHTVGKWRRRFVDARMAGLCDRRTRRAPAPKPVGNAHLRQLHELAVLLSRGATFGPWPAARPLARTRQAGRVAGAS